MLDYTTSGLTGKPWWTDLFRYLIEHCSQVRWVDTVFVLVDNRGLILPCTMYVLRRKELKTHNTFQLGKSLFFKKLKIFEKPVSVFAETFSCKPFLV